MSLDITLTATIRTTVIDKGVTHNLSTMWRECGVYDALYNSQGQRASEVLPALKEGLSKLKDAPTHYLQFEPSNGYGTYLHAVAWLDELVQGFEQYPDGVISVCK